MRRIAIVSLLSVTMMLSAVTHAFAQEKAESATETAVETSLFDGLTFNDAVEIALKDAGLEEDAVKFSKKMHSVEDGHMVYEISFIVPGETKYAYEINDKDGEIIEKGSSSWDAEDDAEYAALISETKNYFDFEAAESQIVVMPAKSILIDECAKERQMELIIYRDGFKYDDGKFVYELSEMIPKKAKFEYKFDMETGKVIESEKEGWEAEDNYEFQGILLSNGFSVD